MQGIIPLGGEDTERVFMKDLTFELPTGQMVDVKKSNFPLAKSMEDVFCRHMNRYALMRLFTRPGHRVLDFPCGSGYASEMLTEWGSGYFGLERDELTVEYAKRVYGSGNVSFGIGDLIRPEIPPDHFNVIGCIEGLEHIGQEFQEPLIAALKSGLTDDGVLIVSSPVNPSGVSGPSQHNADHLWELTAEDFKNLLLTQFKPDEVSIISHTAELSTGVKTTCLYGICQV